MKADDYVKIARELLASPPLRSAIWKDMSPEEGVADEEDIVFEVLRRLLSEVKKLADARKANTDEAIVSIMKELRAKWYAICDRMEHPMFIHSSFDRFLAIMNKKTAHQPVRPQKKPRPLDD